MILVPFYKSIKIIKDIKGKPIIDNCKRYNKDNFSLKLNI